MNRLCAGNLSRGVAVPCIQTNITAMKRRIPHLLLVIATVFTMGYARAAEPIRLNTGGNERPASERALERSLNRHLSFPLLEKGDMTGKVFVSFAIDKEGRIEVLSCSSTNERLRAYVLRKLALVDVGENPDGIWKTSHLVINFHPENS